MTFHIAGAPTYDSVKVEKSLEDIGKDLDELTTRLNNMNQELADIKQALNDLPDLIAKSVMETLREQRKSH